MGGTRRNREEQTERIEIEDRERERGRERKRDREREGHILQYEDDHKNSSVTRIRTFIPITGNHWTVYVRRPYALQIPTARY